MTDDVKTLIAEASVIAYYAAEQGHHGVSRMIGELVAALEAATSAPAVDREALASVLEGFIEGLRAERRLYPDLYRLELSDAVITHLGARDALQSSAPAVDREALAETIRQVASRGQYQMPDDSVPYEQWSLGMADAVMAALGARDVRDVQAEALEQVRDEIRSLACWTDPATGRSGFNVGNDEDGEAGARMAVLDILSQAIREARSER